MPYSERRMVENEKLARRVNRQLEDRVTEIRRDEGADTDAPIQFFCECPFLGCRERLEASSAEYGRVHSTPEHFVVVDGHEVLAVESVVDRIRDFLVVRKRAEAVRAVPEPTDADIDKDDDPTTKE